ncbi:MAG: hypothetical protein JNL64_00095 [Blastocatellia bacterium]|nr:hypothetical protein [Blastocatellia bacterium]
MHSEPRMNSLANISRVLVCLSVFTIIAVGYFGSAGTVETAETIAPPTRIERGVAPRAPIAPSGAVPFDFDGDEKTDIGRWHGASTEYKVWKSGSSEYQTTTIGTSSAKAISGDFDNDNKYDVGTFAAGAWNIKKSSDGNTISASFGTTGDIPVAGDFGGNGTSDCAVFRPSTSVWWILPDCTGSYSSTSYGTSGDIPVTGDYDGDGKTDIAVFRPSTGYWYANRSAAGSLAVQWGVSTDVPMSADFDEDGSDDLVIFRPSSGTWYVLFSDGDFTSYSSNVWGNWYDQPVPGDYDGDGITDRAIWRQTTSEWWIEKSSGGTLTYTLGIPGDTAIPSAFIKQVGGTASGFEVATSRLDPENATGGTDLYSRNFSWGTSLVSLPGRSGLDAGLGLSYNSLVWIKTGGSMYFNPDAGNVAPGFRLGLPTIEPIYYNDSRSKWAYMMVTPSGKRVEFVETSVDELFITTDSSYTQLVTGTTTAPNVPSEGVTMTVKSTDGTQMTYSWNSGAYRCTRVKDRNGNYIDIAYSAYGQITSITDTLGRVINVVYDEYGRVWKIQQTWNASNGTGSATTHTYATLTYTTKTVATNWGVSFYGPPNDTAVTVLDKVTYADGSATKFEYNGYIQVKKVTNIAADTTTNLNYIETDLANVSGSQSDVPRVGETRNWAKDFNVISGTTTAVVVTNSAPASATYTIDGVTATGTKIDVGVTGHPDSLFTRYWFHSSGWKKGMPIGTEDCVSSTCTGIDRKRWTSTDWTQDNDSVSYILNPRVIRSKVGDGSNTKKSEIDYWLYENTTVAVSGLVKESRIYDTDGTTVLKKAYTEYNLASEYVASSIIGLPAMTAVYGRDEYGLQLVGKTTYAYDEGNFSGTGQTISPVKHDGTNYGSSFIAGRGNVTTIKRWDATAPTTVSTESTVKYNTAGSVVSKTTPWDGTNTRTVSISYTDTASWNDGVSRTTYAYPTSITDPNNQSSTVKYRYDIGANVEATSPAPAGQTYGKTSKRWYDSIGRLEKDSVYVDSTAKFYTRYEYPNNGTHSKVFSTITDVSGSTAGPDTADEVLSEQFTDGAGRVTHSRSPHTFNTNGTTASYSAVRVEYDLLGRVKKQSVPTEVASDFTPIGDDATRGYLWTHQKYDWKNRVVRKINTDGIDQTELNDSDVIIGYEGCGCAGGQITTIESERVPYGTSSFARRKKKIHEDILGRTEMTESFEWDGTTVYNTTTATYNGRDQVVLARQYAGTTSSEVFQDTTATFDGFGRLATSHKPEQRDNSNNLKYTSYSYNLDDSIQSMTDGRGVVTNYTYNSRGLATNIAWNVGSTGVTDPTDVTFAYDNLGNRTQMTDGMGQVDYEYDSLSRIIAETRDFTDTLVDSPISGGKFKLEYSYNLAGQLLSYSDPYGETINYSQDKLGRLSNVTGTSFGGVSTYANNPQYRAWGGLKHLEYGTGLQMNATYNNRLQVDSFLLNQISNNSIKTFDKSYQYYADGKLKLSDESALSYLDRFDRSFTYDHQGRIKEAKSGTEAHGTTETDLSKLPYRQSYTFNAFDNLKERESTLWNYTSGDWDFDYTISNNRVAWASYDHDGRQTYDGEGISLHFDGAGRLEATENGNADYETQVSRDGNGQELKRKQRTYNHETNQWRDWETHYFVPSTVLKHNVSETTATGKKKNTYVIGAQSLIARQDLSSTDTEFVVWQNSDASGLSSRGFDNQEFDGLGNNVGTIAAIQPRQPSNTESPNQGVLFDDMTIGDCEVDGILTPCSMAFMLAGSGAASVDYMAPNAFRNFSSRMIGGGKWVEFLEPDLGTVDLRGTQDSSVTISAGASSLQFVPEISWELSIEVTEDEPVKLPPSNPPTNGIPKDCETAIRQGLTDGEQVWNKVLQLMKDPPLFDIEGLPPSEIFDEDGAVSLGGEYSRANYYFGAMANERESLGSAFDRLSLGADAFTIRGRGTIEGIYFRGSKGSITKLLLLHEIVHLAFPLSITNSGSLDLDEVLVNELDLKRMPGQSAFEAVSDYFNSGCNRALAWGNWRG